MSIAAYWFFGFIVAAALHFALILQAFNDFEKAFGSEFYILAVWLLYFGVGIGYTLSKVL